MRSEPRAARRVGVASARPPTGALVDLLERAKHQFTPADRAVKRMVLTALAERPIRDGGLLLQFHEALCFLRAYPDDDGLLQVVEGALAKFGARVTDLLASGPTAETEILSESGIAATTVYCPLSHAAVHWLAERFPESVEIDWDDAASEEGLSAILPLLVDVLAEEALVEVGVPYRAWLAAAKADSRRSDLVWILDRLDSAAPRALYDQVQPRVRWDLDESAASRTLAKLPVSRLFFHRRALVRWRGPVSRRLPGPRVRVRAASPEGAGDILDAARAAVLVRYREVHAFNFANPADVVVADVGRGVQIAWLGVLPEHRLPLRAHYGYLVLKNGVPVGYGDASLLCDWCEIAYNIFETFRRGESAFIFARLLACLFQWLRVRAFHLSAYQLGYGNDEALESGAFWFYYKLGFRPTRPDLRRLARVERQRIAHDPTYRSSRETLERFCAGRMFLSVGGSADRSVSDFEVRRAGLRAAARAARLGADAVLGTVARSLRAARWRAWPQAERVALERLAPFLALIPDLAEWSIGERRALVEVVRAKGGLPEADYLRRMQAHPRLRRSLLALGGRAGSKERERPSAASPAGRCDVTY